MSPGCFVGIDVSKDQLDVAQRPGRAQWQVRNDGQGIAELLGRLQEIGPDLIVLEATGGWSLRPLG